MPSHHSSTITTLAYILSFDLVSGEIKYRHLVWKCFKWHIETRYFLAMTPTTRSSLVGNAVGVGVHIVTLMRLQPPQVMRLDLWDLLPHLNRYLCTGYSRTTLRGSESKGLADIKNGEWMRNPLNHDPESRWWQCIGTALLFKFFMYCNKTASLNTLVHRRHGGHLHCGPGRGAVVLKFGAKCLHHMKSSRGLV